MNWETLSPDNSLAQGCSCTVLDDSAYVIGGSSSTESFANPSTHLRVSCFSIKALEWQGVHVNANGIMNRRNHAAVSLNGSVVVFGGTLVQSCSGNEDLCEDVVTCTPSPFGIRCLSVETPSMARMGHSANVFGDGKRAVIFGGNTAEGISSEALIYAPAGEGWIPVEVEGQGPSGRTYHSAVVCGDSNQYLVVSGGLTAAAEGAAGVVATGEVWVLDLTAYIVDVPPEPAEPVDTKGKKGGKAGAGPAKPTATWMLVADAGGIFEPRFRHFTYVADPTASPMRLCVLGGMSQTSPPASTNTMVSVDLTKSGTDFALEAVDEDAPVGPHASSYGCVYASLSEPVSAELPSAEEEGASPRSPPVVPMSAPAAILMLNQGTMNTLELPPRQPALSRQGSHSSVPGSHKPSGSVKSSHSHKHSREVAAANVSSGVKMYALGDSEYVERLRWQVTENARLALLRANKGRVEESPDGVDRWAQLFRDRAIDSGDGNTYVGDVVYVGGGETLTLESRPNEKSAETALIERISGVDSVYRPVRHGKGVLKVTGSETEYSGDWCDDCMAGEGTFVNRESGLVYKGQFAANVFDGVGKLYYGLQAGELYDGQFAGGQRHGVGRLYAVRLKPLGGQQLGSEVGLEIIDGVESTAYECNLTVIYDGDWVKDARTGHGTYILPDGSTYTGCLLENLPNGNDGVCVYGDGSKYTGQWRAGKRNGFGKYTTVREECYEGKWVNDQRCGRGVWKSQLTGEFYDGNWERHLPNGSGKRVYSDQNVYTGEFVDGLRHGVGTMVYQAVPGKGRGGSLGSTSTYTGNWYKNLRHGQGKWIMMGTAGGVSCDSSVSSLGSGGQGSAVLGSASGSVNKTPAADAEILYEGEWFADKRSGPGKASYQSGKTFSGIFENDFPVE